MDTPASSPPDLGTLAAEQPPPQPGSQPSGPSAVPWLEGESRAQCVQMRPLTAPNSTSSSALAVMPAAAPMARRRSLRAWPARQHQRRGPPPSRPGSDGRRTGKERGSICRGKSRVHWACARMQTPVSSPLRPSSSAAVRPSTRTTHEPVTKSGKQQSSESSVLRAEAGSKRPRCNPIPLSRLSPRPRI
ncbi:uncharacterized protein BDZ99DRAFT_286421 [Mytilinidion resinicola]|uniref:Uncharacterized protein n=1 Tax=Mytilinidion resinicola TaxID=574789 RepID=A0A6A6YRH8_9PEZI|nr:uncharacterized protein BDZ99DRAFT_286421 [Mytilinidion resinicola]KAF2810644.1 hypothetical protein BDZ99DRAFT_286421 [Mytilinidion resinicola]